MGHHKTSGYLGYLRQSYRTCDLSGKKRIINEVCLNLKWHRKSVIRALNRPPRKTFHYKRAKKYSPESQEALKKLWLLMGQMCSKKMKVALPKWLPHYEEKMSETVKKELLSMSASTMDRYLKRHRVRYRRRKRSGTNPSRIKNRIPIKPLSHQITDCGVIEVDTVAHCGDSIGGEFAWSLTLTDVHTGWTENAAVLGKGSHGVLEAIKKCQGNFPFAIRELHSDNGTEFLNQHLIRYLSEKKIRMQRSRPYKKNDQCHVEQKNYTHVRELFGYSRIESKEAVDLMTKIYLEHWSKLQNFFVPQLKLKRKIRMGSRYRREYTAPLTPYERCMNDSTVTMLMKSKLKKEFESLNPFILSQEVQRLARIVFKLSRNIPMRRAS